MTPKKIMKSKLQMVNKKNTFIIRGKPKVNINT